MAPSKNDAKSKTPKPAPKAAVMAAAPATDPACPLPPKAKTHVVLLGDDAKVGDRVMCENDHLLVVTSLAPPQFVKA
jgi:hypothetical protein